MLRRSNSSWRKIVIAALALCDISVSAYQNIFRCVGSDPLSATVPVLHENGSFFQERLESLSSKQGGSANQLSEMQQANVDKYLVFLEHRYQRLNDKGINSQWTWRWHLKETNEQQFLEHNNALHIFGISNLASRKLLERYDIHTRSKCGKVSFQRRWSIELQNYFKNAFFLLLNPRNLKPPTRRITPSVIIASVSVVIYKLCFLR